MFICDRINKEILEKNGLCAILVSDPYNFRYLSGSDAEGVLLIAKDEALLFTDSRYTIAAKAAAEPNGFRVVEYTVENPLKKLLKEEISDIGLHNAATGISLGYEDQFLTVSKYNKYREALPEAEFVPLGNALDELRMVKTSDEIALLEKAERIGDMAFETILPMIKPGVTELSLAAQIEYAMKQNGAEGLSFETIVASGPNSACPHHRPTDRPFEAGDFITMDFGCVYHGYCSDMTRTVVLGKASDEQKKVYETVLRAHKAGLEALKPGLTGKQIDAAARDIIKEAGYGEYFGHGLGHSVGLYIHEDPRLSPSEDRVIGEGYIETVEPGIYIEGFGGVRIEDMCVVTKDGCRSLAGSPKELLELG